MSAEYTRKLEQLFKKFKATIYSNNQKTVRYLVINLTKEIQDLLKIIKLSPKTLNNNEATFTDHLLSDGHCFE